MEAGSGPHFLYKVTAPTIRNFEQNGVYFSQPRLVAIYEQNYDKIVPARKILYFKDPRLLEYPINLNYNNKTYIKQSVSNANSIAASLKYGMSSAFNSKNNIEVGETKVFARRSTLTTIMESIYIKENHYWSIRVSRHRGNIFMIKEEFIKIPSETFFHNEHLDRLLFSESPNKSPGANQPVNENIKLLSVHRSYLGKFDMIYSGEIPAIIANEEIKDLEDIKALNKCRFVLVKQVWRHIKLTDYRYLQYFLQANLTNVEDLYIAFKNGRAIVEEPIEHKNVSELPDNRYWKPLVCTSFLCDFLHYVEAVMSNINCLNTVYIFRYNPDERIVSYEIYKGKTEKSFISKEYIEYCNEA